MQKFDTPAPISAVLDIPAGRIQFIAADRADTTVEVLPADASKSRDVKAAEQTTVAYADGVLRIDGRQAAKNRVLGPSGSVEVTVQLPAGSRVEAKAASAELRGVGRLGDVAFEGAHGHDQARRGRASASPSRRGDVTVGRLSGPGEISTRRATSASPRPCAARSRCAPSPASITVGAARGVSATLDAGTRYGRITTPSRTPTAPPPSSTIRATTTYGDITARSL